MTSGEAPFPKIGPGAAHAVIPRVSGAYFDPEWNRLAAIRVQGRGLTGDFASAVTAASMSYSATQVGELSLTFQDTQDGEFLGSGMFRGGVVIDYLNQHLEVRSIDLSAGDGGPVITIKARSRVIGALTGKGHSGRGSWGTQVVEEWVTGRCQEAGARSVIQTGFGRLLFTRDNSNDTTWGMMQRAAQAVGAWCFECENTIYFARPTWLSARSRARWWPLRYMNTSDYTPGMVGLPSWHWAAEGDTTLGFDLVSGDAEIIRPGDGVELSGNVGWASGDWVVTQVDLPLTTTEATGVSCTRIVDPVPQPLTGGG